jgi:hypothetical protein
MSRGCPACGAGFRGSARCSRCGADLSVVMGLAAAAFLLRGRARRLLIEGELDAAATVARGAQRLDRSPAGEALVRVTSLLKTAAAGPRRAPRS